MKLVGFHDHDTHHLVHKNHNYRVRISMGTTRHWISNILIGMAVTI